MSELFSRTARLIGENALEKLKNSSVLIFGVGGVGSYIAESLARSGVGHICIVDGDTVSESNINRQAQALVTTVGECKADAMAERLRLINPDIDVRTEKIFFLPENADTIDFSGFDFVCDAVDTVSAKIEIVMRAQAAEVPLVSCMGTGNKLAPEMLEITDIYKTEGDPLARVMRRALKSRGVKKLTVVYSREVPKKDGERTPASMAFVPNSAGLLCASHIVRELIK